MTRPARSQAPLVLEGIDFAVSRGLFRGRLQVLSGVSISVPAGSVVGLTGPNGSGKSTLLTIAAGLARPTRGTVRILGASPTNDRIRRALGFLPDASPFPGELSAWRVLDLLAGLHGFPRKQRRRRCAALLERTGLAHVAHRPLGRSSRGMLRRFGLAQAFLHDPRVILLDEPTAGLDALGFAVLTGFLEEARQRGAAVLFTSHTWDDLASGADRVDVLVEGRCVRSAPPGELLTEEERLADLYAAAAGARDPGR